MIVLEQPFAVKLKLIASVVSFQSGRCINLSSGVSCGSRREDTKFTRNGILIGQCAQFFIYPTVSSAHRVYCIPRLFRHHSNLLQSEATARRTSDAGVEECKGYSPPNDHTTSASSTPLPLGSWNLNTGTRPTESERSAHVARKWARYAQRTERQRLHDAHQKRMRGGSWRQHLRGASPGTGKYGLLHSDLKTT